MGLNPTRQSSSGRCSSRTDEVTRAVALRLSDQPVKRGDRHRKPILAIGTIFLCAAAAHEVVTGSDINYFVNLWVAGCP